MGVTTKDPLSLVYECISLRVQALQFVFVALFDGDGGFVTDFTTSLICHAAGMISLEQRTDCGEKSHTSPVLFGNLAPHVGAIIKE